MIVGATVICPPAGLALGATYGTLKLNYAVSGEDWLTGRELSTGERWMRGALSPLDIVPGVAGLKKFGTGVRLSNQALDMGQLAAKPGLRSTIQREITHVGDMVNTAGAMTVQRVRSAGSAVKDATRVAGNRISRGLQDAGRLADSAVTSAKNIVPKRNVVAAGDVGRVHMPAENTHFFENNARQMFNRAEGVGGGGTQDTSEFKFENVGDYFNHINDVGKRTDLTPDQKLERIHDAYRALGDIKGDVTVVADIKYLKPEAFGPNGRFIVDWPDKMGFAEDSIQAVNRNNPLPEQWDRIGGKGGENFTTMPDNGVPFTYNERAIPYLENPSARHVGTFDNNSYFDAIDAVKGGNLEDLNKIVTVNGRNPISQVEFDRFTQSYADFQSNVKTVIGDVAATYGLNDHLLKQVDLDMKCRRLKSLFRLKSCSKSIS